MKNLYKIKLTLENGTTFLTTIHFNYKQALMIKRIYQYETKTKYKKVELINEIVGNVLFVRIKNENVVSLTESEKEALKENLIINMFRTLNIE